MDKSLISIATITLVRDEAEGRLMRESLQQLASLEIPVFITDGGSDSSFINFLKSIPQFHLSQANVKGVWAQAKNSLLEAFNSGSEFIFYTEPDKFNFFRQHLATMLDAIETDEQTGIYMASRSDAAFATFPPFQQMTEKTINNCNAEVIGKNVDYTYGPFLLNSKLIPFLDLVQEDIGWGWRPYIFGIAKRLGYQVETFISDFYCPEDQREENAKERIHRMKQLQQNVTGIVLSTHVNVESLV